MIGDGANYALPTLLLVDDERAFANALAFRLQARGLGCLTAYGGEEALALLDRRELEVVLLDLNMPGLHGLDALRLIKEKTPGRGSDPAHRRSRFFRGRDGHATWRGRLPHQASRHGRPADLR